MSNVTVTRVNAIEPLKLATNHEIIYVLIIRGRYLGVEETLRVVGLKGPRRVKLLSGENPTDFAC